MDGHRHYVWAANETPPLIQPHSVAKHEVIGAYLTKYVSVLCRQPRVNRLSLALVDGFAGGGVYRLANGTTHEGSPVVMLSSMASAEAAEQSRRRAPFDLDVEYFFVDRDKRAVGHLDWYLRQRGFAGRMGSNIHLLTDEFNNVLPQLTSRIAARAKRHGKARCIFVLDQYGYSAVTMGALRNIFASFEHAEVILNFAVDSLVDYLNETNAATLAQTTGLIVDPAHLLAVKEASDDWRPAIAAMLHTQIFQKSGAKFYTPFFIRSAKSRRSYWLIHLSNHSRARDVMTSLHWEFQNHFSHHGGPGMNMLAGYDPHRDPLAYGQLPLVPVTPLEFNEEARTLTECHLRDDLVRHLRNHPGGVSFGALYAEICNQIPADTEILKDVIRFLRSERELRTVVDGSTTERVEVTNDTMIMPVVQANFSFWAAPSTESGPERRTSFGRSQKTRRRLEKVPTGLVGLPGLDAA